LDDGGGCPSIVPFCNPQHGFRCVECRNNDDCGDAAVGGVCKTDIGQCNPDQSFVRPPPADAGVVDSGDAAIDAQTPDAADAGD
jgi:hypothetical protein